MRKTILVSIYYEGKEPRLSLEDPRDYEFTYMDDPDWLFLNDAIEMVLEENNPDSKIVDVAIDVTKPWLFNNSNWFSRKLFKLVRVKRR